MICSYWSSWSHCAAWLHCHCILVSRTQVGSCTIYDLPGCIHRYSKITCVVLALKGVKIKTLFNAYIEQFVSWACFYFDIMKNMAAVNILVKEYAKTRDIFTPFDPCTIFSNHAHICNFYLIFPCVANRGILLNVIHKFIGHYPFLLLLCSDRHEGRLKVPGCGLGGRVRS